MIDIFAQEKVSRILLVFVAAVFFIPQSVVALPTPEATYEDYMFVHCLREKFPNIQRGHGNDPSHGHGYAYDPDSGRNFAWDKNSETWIDTKTLKPICPKSESQKKAVYEDYLFAHCLREKFPNIQRGHGNDPSHGHGYAYDPDSQRNFAWDKEKQAWIDTKTLQCICPKCEEKRTAHIPSQTPTPSTTDKVTDVLKTIGSSVSIGVGGGTSGGHERHRGEDRHRTTEKSGGGKTSTRTTGKTTSSSGKTVTAGCKCHPCNCSPCRCH